MGETLPLATCNTSLSSSRKDARRARAVLDSSCQWHAVARESLTKARLTGAVGLYEFWI